MKTWCLPGLIICWSVLTAPVAFGQSVHDHNQFHGLSQTIQPNLPQGTEGLFIEFRWQNQANADVDGHVQLPAGFGPYNVTQTINFSRTDQPFAGGPQNRRIYPSQSGVRFNNDAAFAFHSGDQGGGAPAGVGCVEPNGGSCEVIAITGQVPTATYGVGIHNFNFFNIPNSTADYEVIAYANNGRVVMNGGSSHLTTNSISGTNLQTGQSRIASVDYVFTGNSRHAVGVNELISTMGHAVGVDKLQAMHTFQVASGQNVDPKSLLANSKPFLNGIHQQEEAITWVCGENCYPFLSEDATLAEKIEFGYLVFGGTVDHAIDMAYEPKRRFDLASEIAESITIPGHNNETDALRHATWTNSMSQEVGPAYARAFGIGYEIRGLFKGQPLEEAIMDLSNNREGINAFADDRAIDPRNLIDLSNDDPSIIQYLFDSNANR